MRLDGDATASNMKLLVLFGAIALAKAGSPTTTLKVCPVGYDSATPVTGELVCLIGASGPNALQGCHSSCPATYQGGATKCCDSGECLGNDPFCRYPSTQACADGCCPSDGRHQRCGSSLCAPPGYQCCGNNNVCESTDTCCNGQCYPGSVVCCSDAQGNTYTCANGQQCAGNGICCPAGYPKGCSDSYYGLTCHKENGGNCACCGDQCCYGDYALCCKNPNPSKCQNKRQTCTPWFGNQTVCGNFCTKPLGPPPGVAGGRNAVNRLGPAPRGLLNQTNFACNADPSSLAKDLTSALNCFSQMASCSSLFGPSTNFYHNYVTVLNNFRSGQMSYLMQPDARNAILLTQKCLASWIQSNLFGASTLLPTCSSLTHHWTSSQATTTENNCWNNPNGFCDISTYIGSSNGWSQLFNSFRPPVDSRHFFTQVCLNSNLENVKLTKSQSKH